MEQEITVLIIEDDPDIRRYFENTAEFLFSEKVCIAFATGLGDAQVLFEKLIEAGLDMIFIDACLGSRIPNSMPLIKFISTNFQGPIYAMSCNKTFIAPLLRAGCTDTCSKQKFYRPIEQLLLSEQRVSQ